MESPLVSKVRSGKYSYKVKSTRQYKAKVAKVISIRYKVNHRPINERVEPTRRRRGMKGGQGKKQGPTNHNQRQPNEHPRIRTNNQHPTKTNGRHTRQGEGKAKQRLQRYARVGYMVKLEGVKGKV